MLKNKTEDKIKFEYNYDGHVVTVEVRGGGADYSDLVDRFKEFSLAIGFHPDTVKEYLGED